MGKKRNMLSDAEAQLIIDGLTPKKKPSVSAAPAAQPEDEKVEEVKQNDTTVTVPKTVEEPLLTVEEKQDVHPIVKAILTHPTVELLKAIRDAFGYTEPESGTEAIVENCAAADPRLQGCDDETHYCEEAEASYGSKRVRYMRDGELVPCLVRKPRRRNKEQEEREMMAELLMNLRDVMPKVEELIDNYPDDVCESKSEDDCSGNCAWENGACGPSTAAQVAEMARSAALVTEVQDEVRTLNKDRVQTKNYTKKYQMAVLRRSAAMAAHNEYMRKFLERAYEFENMLEEHARLCASDKACASSQCTLRGNTCLLSKGEGKIWVRHYPRHAATRSTIREPPWTPTLEGGGDENVFYMQATTEADHFIDGYTVILKLYGLKSEDVNMNRGRPFASAEAAVLYAYRMQYYEATGLAYELEHVERKMETMELRLANKEIDRKTYDNFMEHARLFRESNPNILFNDFLRVDAETMRSKFQTGAGKILEMQMVEDDYNMLIEHLKEIQTSIDTALKNMVTSKESLSKELNEACKNGEKKEECEAKRNAMRDVEESIKGMEKQRAEITEQINQETTKHDIYMKEYMSADHFRMQKEVFKTMNENHSSLYDSTKPDPISSSDWFEAAPWGKRTFTLNESAAAAYNVGMTPAQRGREKALSALINSAKYYIEFVKGLRENDMIVLESSKTIWALYLKYRTALPDLEEFKETPMENYNEIKVVHNKEVYTFDTSDWTSQREGVGIAERARGWLWLDRGDWKPPPEWRGEHQRLLNLLRKSATSRLNFILNSRLLPSMFDGSQEIADTVSAGVDISVEGDKPVVYAVRPYESASGVWESERVYLRGKVIEKNGGLARLEVTQRSEDEGETYASIDTSFETIVPEDRLTDVPGNGDLVQIEQLGLATAKPIMPIPLSEKDREPLMAPYWNIAVALCESTRDNYSNKILREKALRYIRVLQPYIDPQDHCDLKNLAWVVVKDVEDTLTRMKDNYEKARDHWFWLPDGIWMYPCRQKGKNIGYVLATDMMTAKTTGTLSSIWEYLWGKTPEYKVRESVQYTAEDGTLRYGPITEIKKDVYTIRVGDGEFVQKTLGQFEYQATFEPGTYVLLRQDFENKIKGVEVVKIVKRLEDSVHRYSVALLNGEESEAQIANLLPFPAGKSPPVYKQGDEVIRRSKKECDRVSGKVQTIVFKSNRWRIVVQEGEYPERDFVLRQTHEKPEREKTVEDYFRRPIFELPDNFLYKGKKENLAYVKPEAVDEVRERNKSVLDEGFVSKISNLIRWRKSKQDAFQSWAMNDLSCKILEEEYVECREEEEGQYSVESVAEYVDWGQKEKGTCPYLVGILSNDIPLVVYADELSEVQELKGVKINSLIEITRFGGDPPLNVGTATTLSGGGRRVKDMELSLKILENANGDRAKIQTLRKQIQSARKDEDLVDLSLHARKYDSPIPIFAGGERDPLLQGKYMNVVIWNNEKINKKFPLRNYDPETPDEPGLFQENIDGKLVGKVLDLSDYAEVEFRNANGCVVQCSIDISSSRVKLYEESSILY